ncbi:MAG: PAS domain S-box protein [Deltaproteobacteria bacterium]|jgi:PAS domain S-box-containing protein
MSPKPSYQELEKRVRELQQEVSQLKKAEKEVRQSEQQWRSLLEDAPAQVIIVNRDGIIQYVNFTVSPLEVKKVVGTSQYDYMPRDYHKVVKKALDSVFRTGQSIDYEIEGVGPDGQSAWYMSQVGPVKRGRKVVAAVIIPRDITERKKVEKALRESEERYRSLFNGAAEGILVADIKTRTFKYANPAICRMLGYTEKELVGMRVNDIHPQKALKSVLSEFKAQAAGVKSLAPNIPCLRKDGTTLYTDINTTSIFIDETRCNVGFFTDITERRNAEQQIKDRQKVLEAKTVELAELNTALRVLLRQRDRDKSNLEEKVLLNIREFALPYIDKLRQKVSGTDQVAYLNIVESNLNDITSGFAQTLSVKYSSLTPTEIQISHLIRQGRTTKEIAELLSLSARTIESHRQNIRIKMGMKNKKTNLRSHLLSI